jgi:hypothetical protein
VEKVLRSAIGDKDFSLEHLYAVLLHYKQPVEGLDDLKDDQQLWDLFNGNTDTTRPKARPKTAKATKKGAAKQSAAKITNSQRGTPTKRKARKPATRAKRAPQARRSSTKRR